jgi:DNA (cytosine-5)-methyltransferase 1
MPTKLVKREVLQASAGGLARSQVRRRTGGVILQAALPIRDAFSSDSQARINICFLFAISEDFSLKSFRYERGSLMNTYPLFHRELRDNSGRPLADPLECHSFTSENRMGAIRMEHTFYEFFAGGGMARAGLGEGWKCLFANDFDYKKGETYRRNWGDKELRTVDVGKLKASDLPGSADLAWASFPCQDLSLAGGGAGLKGDRSGTFWPFWKLMKTLLIEDHSPRIIVLENVCGTLTSHDGRDFTTICTAVQQAGYTFGAFVVDASLFVPQSRPRLFIVCVRADLGIPGECVSEAPLSAWHSRVVGPYLALSKKIKDKWVWWKLPLPPRRQTGLSDLIEENPRDVAIYSPEQTRDLISKMSDVNRAKLTKAVRLNRPVIGGLYRRTRIDADGMKVQRAEIRFDDLSGCLRTPAGGSSRQTILIVSGDSIRARLISTRETARLMGLPDSYILPENYNEAYHLTGDGVVVPVVRHIAANLFEPILQDAKLRRMTAA